MYVGGLYVGLTEGDVAVVFSQLGEVVDVHLPRDKKTGKPRGFAFVGYEDQRSTVLAVDNFNGAKLLGRTLRVDHCEKYRLPKEVLETRLLTQEAWMFDFKKQIDLVGISQQHLHEVEAREASMRAENVQARAYARHDVLSHFGYFPF